MNGETRLRNHWSYVLSGLVRSLAFGFFFAISFSFSESGFDLRAFLAVGLVFIACLSLACGLILDTVVKGTRHEYELDVIEAYRRYR